MSRYIDADKIEYAPCTVYEHNGKDVTEMIAYKKLIDIMPTADVEEVRHGYWKMCYYPNDEHVECSECHAQYYENDLYLGGNEFPKRCPECGAHMKKEKEE